MELVRDALQPGYEEAVSHGMATWSVPLARLPTTYNGEPLMHAAVAARKRHCSLYLMGLYADPGVGPGRGASARGGPRRGAGSTSARAACASGRRPTSTSTLLREVLGALSVEEYVALYERSRRRRRRSAAALTQIV